MKELLEIFKNVKEEFCSLWQFKERGATLEIITPFTLTTNKFVSVFLTIKNREFVVTDGGWITDNTYDAKIDFEDNSFEKLFQYYLQHYSIATVEGNGNTYYYKKCSKKELLPNAVFDLANFITAVVSGSQIQFIDAIEKEERKFFRQEANTYISSIVPKDKEKKKNIYFRHHAHESIKSLKFSAIIIRKNKMTVVNYITGSTLDYFMGSIGKTNIMFEVLKKSVVAKEVDHSIALIHDNAQGYQKEKLYNFLEQLQTVTENNNINWHEREKLASILN